MSTKAKNTSMYARSGKATAGHEQSGDEHIVGFGNLRVVICQEGEQWFAQGLEIDYAADGTSLDDVKKNFEEGLAGTIHLHLKAYGNLKNLLKIAPPDAWEDWYKEAKKMRYSQVSIHDLFEEDETPEELPFFQIDYLGAAA